MASPLAKDILIALPTNNCARVLLFIKLNRLDDVVEIKSPKDFGGLKSEEYMLINPQSKFPAFVSGNGQFRLFEAQVILDYLADKYADRLQSSKFCCQTPSILSCPEQRAKCRLIIQVHDLYIASANCTQPGYFATQGCLYKAEMALLDRCAKMLELQKQLDVLESMWDETGPYCCGSELTLADLVVYPTMIFVVDLWNASLGWDTNEMLSRRPKLSKWYLYFEKSDEDLPGLREVAQGVHAFCENVFLKSGKCEKICASLDCDEARTALSVA